MSSRTEFKIESGRLSTDGTSRALSVRRSNRFGVLVRRLRMEAGYTLRGFARIFGVSPGYLSRLETGRDPPPPDSRIVRLATLLRVVPDELRSAAGRVDPELNRYICSVRSLPAFLRRARQKGLGDEEFEDFEERLAELDR